MKNSVKVAVCGICTALSTVLMFLGGITYVFSYVVPIILGVLMLMINKTFGKSYAFTVYFATFALSMIIVTEKESVLLYGLFFGYYPIIKPSIEKIKSKFLQIVLKLLLFNFAVALIEVLSFYVFGIPFYEKGKIGLLGFIILFAVLMNVMFASFEFLLKNYYKLYEYKLEPKIKKLFK